MRTAVSIAAVSQERRRRALDDAQAEGERSGTVLQDACASRLMSLHNAHAGHLHVDEWARTVWCPAAMQPRESTTQTQNQAELSRTK